MKNPDLSGPGFISVLFFQFQTQHRASEHRTGSDRNDIRDSDIRLRVDQQHIVRDRQIGLFADVGKPEMQIDNPAAQ